MYKYWSYKCYNSFFYRTVRINVFSFIFSKNSIFHVIKKVFRSKTSTYIGKLKKISQTIRIIGPVQIIITLFYKDMFIHFRFIASPSSELSWY
jgi:hypothetical protein